MDDTIFTKDSLKIINDLGSLQSSFDGKRVLLTGGAGFLGSNLVHYFTSLNDSGILTSRTIVTVVDNFMFGLPPWLDYCKNRNDVVFVTGDISEMPSLDGHYDFIMHAASIASPTFYRRFPVETMKANINGLWTLLERSRIDKPESLLFFSSSEVYGDPPQDKIPTPETYWGNVSCTGPRACYDESKRFGETLCTNYFRAYGVPVKIARPFNNYGPGLGISDRRVLPDFFMNVLKGENIVLLSDGNPTRTFCYVSDAVNGYIRLLLSSHNGESFNIGNDQGLISMKELAELVIRISGTSLKVVCESSGDKDYLRDNPQRRCPVISKAKTLLGYYPKVDLETGILNSFGFYRTYYGEQLQRNQK